MSHFIFNVSPFNLASSHQDAHVVLRMLAFHKRQTDVDKFGEQFVQRNVLDLQILALTILQNAQKDPAHLEKDILLSDALIVCHLFIYFNEFLLCQHINSLLISDCFWFFWLSLLSRRLLFLIILTCH